MLLFRIKQIESEIRTLRLKLNERQLVIESLRAANEIAAATMDALEGQVKEINGLIGAVE